METFGQNNNFDLSFFLTLSKVTNEIGVSHSQRYSNSLWLCFYTKRETNYSLKHSVASARSIRQKGAQLFHNLFDNLFHSANCIVEHKMRMEGQGEREVRISAKLTFI